MPGPSGDDMLTRIDSYIEGLFSPQDEALREALAESDRSGLPAINVSANQGKLIQVLALLVGARRILELGTLGGYSTIWLARALPADGQLVSLEYSPKHAEVARRNLARAGLSARVEVRVGPALDSLAQLVDEGAPPFDMVFIDADKPPYTEYLAWALRLTRPGSLILADNVVRNGQVLDSASTDSAVQGVQRFNATLAAEPRLASIVLPLAREYIDGMALAVVR